MYQLCPSILSADFNRLGEQIRILEKEGVKIRLLIDGIYQKLFLDGSRDFQALAARDNVEVGIYNPIAPLNLFRLNYRMHDKYVIVDSKMYLLGGRNSNDIFLGDKTTGINMDRDILFMTPANPAL